MPSGPPFVRQLSRSPRCLKRRIEERKHYGVLTAKFVDVLHALLWLIHDSRSGQCNPGYATIADKAGCCPNTVCAAIKALEQAGILSWVNRITRVRVREKDLFGQWVTSWRIVRTSNAYVFHDPKPAARLAEASKTKFWGGPLDTGLKKETLSGARLVGAPVIGLGEPSEALMLRSGWFHSGGKG